MSEWTEGDSVGVSPDWSRRRPPPARDAGADLGHPSVRRRRRISIVELGSTMAGSPTLLEEFLAATLLALDQSESMRATTAAGVARLAGCLRSAASRSRRAIGGTHCLDVDSSLATHHLREAKKRSPYKAVAKVVVRGALYTAARVQPLPAATGAVAKMKRHRTGRFPSARPARRPPRSSGAHAGTDSGRPTPHAGRRRRFILSSG
jgi:hypothetical protein